MKGKIRTLLIITIFSILSLFVFIIVTCFTLEVWARVNSRVTSVGVIGWHDDDVLGWISKPGKGKVITSEYTATYDINSYGMNDNPIEDTIEISRMRILALGDSHTFAVGVNQEQSWPNVLEQILFKRDVKNGSVYNCAVSGYSLGQYLLQMRRMAPIIKPHIVLIGFTIASDVYDLLPPRKGGFVFGADRGRVYFDLDDKGNLVEIHDLVGKRFFSSQPKKATLIMIIRNAITRSAFYQRLKRSRLAMWIMMYVRPKGKTLWASPDTALAIELDEDYRYRWQLAEALIRKIGEEAKEYGAYAVLVNIPYLPQVYDGVWKSSFGRYPNEYDRWIAGYRLKAICAKVGIYYVDVTQRFVDEARIKKKWLHYPIDGHPNPVGHRIIAETVAEFLIKNQLVDY